MTTIKRISHPITLLVVLGLLAASFAAPVQAADALTIHQTVAKGSVKDVLAKITKMVGDNGMMVMGEIHQGKILAMTGLKIESESIFVGNPTMGKKLFSVEPGAGQAVPVRINIYRNSDGKTVVSYIAPSDLLSGFKNPKLTKMGTMLDKKLAGMTGMLGM